MSASVTPKPTGLAAFRGALKARVQQALDNAGRTAAALRDGDAERQRRATAAFKPQPGTGDVYAKGTHQQAVAAANAPTRTGTMAAAHVQAALKGPAPGLQLRSVRVAPSDAGNGPKQQGFAWRAPKTR